VSVETTYFFELKVGPRTLTFAQDAANQNEAFSRIAKRLYRDNFADLASGKLGGFKFVGEL